MARNATGGAGTSGPSLPLGRRALAGIGCAALAVVAVGVAAAGHGSGSTARPVSAAAMAPAGARAGKVVSRPAQIPAAVLPPQTVLTSVQRPYPGITLVTGVVPRSFHDAVQFFVSGLPAAGYVNSAGDAEMDEAEALFNGAGLRGTWKVNGMVNCPDAVTLSLYVRT